MKIRSDRRRVWNFDKSRSGLGLRSVVVVVIREVVAVVVELGGFGGVHADADADADVD